MGKRAYKTASTPEGSALAKKNVELLREAFAAVGVRTKVETWSPGWVEECRRCKPETVTEITIPSVWDAEGEPLSFMFGHNDGRLVRSGY